MPVQALTPWDDLADAYERLHETERAGGDVEGARADVDRAKELCGSVGSLLLVMALESGGLEVQRVLRQAFAGPERLALDKATRAGKRATAALNKLDALHQRIVDLEEMVSHLLPGVREPGR